MRKDFVAYKLDNAALLKRTKQLMNNERKVQSLFLSHLGEVDRRKLYAVEGYSSLFEYCTQVLGLSESSALKRIQVARAARKFPQIYWMVEDSKASLTVLNRVAPHLQPSNAETLLNEVSGKSVREVDILLAKRFPKPESADKRKPLAEDKIHYTFVGDKEFDSMLERAKEILRHKYPRAKMGDVLKEALGTLLKATDPQKKYEQQKQTKSQVKHSAHATRHVPEHVKRVVWPRNNGSCSYVSPSGKRCGSRSFLEWDHKKAWAVGGSSLDPDNIRLLCRTHNQLAAEETFGRAFIHGKIIGVRLRS